ncbi:hypothetical protein P3T24_003036 [Paraburkholderia sp. GAS33]
MRNGMLERLRCAQYAAVAILRMKRANCHDAPRHLSICFCASLLSVSLDAAEADEAAVV